MLRGVTTTIDSLANIIQTVSGGSMSGRLMARRGGGLSLEEGEILFVQGRAVAAKVAFREGMDAFNWMNSWKNCSFSFHPAKESKHIPILPSDIQERSTDPLKIKALGPRQISFEKKIVLQGSNVLVIEPGSLPPGIVPLRIGNHDEALRLLWKSEYSRLHRHIFLLIDGKRTFQQLISLIDRKEVEVARLLRDLEKLHIVHIPY